MASSFTLCPNLGNSFGPSCCGVPTKGFSVIKVGDEVYVKVRKGDFKTVAYEGYAIVTKVISSGCFSVDATRYDVMTIMGDTIRKLTKLDKALK